MVDIVTWRADRSGDLIRDVDDAVCFDGLTSTRPVQVAGV